MAGMFNMDESFKIVKDIFIAILKYPFEFWFSVPDWIKYSLGTLILIISIGIVILILKNKDAWKHRKY